MIKVCSSCSNVNVEAIKKVVGEDKLTIGCIENCAAHKEKSYGFINDEMVVTETSEAFIEAVKNSL